jgi:acetoin utilization deacetylase AcuC-like enzyme
MQTFIAQTRMPINPTNFVDLQPLINEFKPAACVCTDIDREKLDSQQTLLAAASREYPTSPDMQAVADHFLDGCVATDMAVNYALLHKVSVNLGGGYHHATMDPSQAAYGCLINDFGFAISQHPKLKIGILDFDMHRGGGTATIVHNLNNVYLYDLHHPSGQLIQDWQLLENNNRIRTASGSIHFLRDTHQIIGGMFVGDVIMQQPDLVIYNAGADAENMPLNLTQLLLRDQWSFTELNKHNIPVAITLGGGYDDKAILYWRQMLRLADEILK